MAKVISLRGDIIDNGDKWIYDWFGYDSTCPNDVIQILNTVNGSEDIIIQMNSGGGSVIPAHDIYTAIASYKGNIEIHVVGFAGSAASEILMACKSLISPVAAIMIHNCATEASGDYRVMDSTSQMLQTINQGIRNAYKAKTGMSDEELINLMDKTTWMTAQEAVEKGFVDGLMFEDENNTDPSDKLLNVINQKEHIAIYNSTVHLSREIIEKLRNTIKLDKRNNLNMENKKLDEQQKNNADNQAFILNNHSNEGGNNMTLEELMKQHPELQNELDAIKVTAKQEGVTEERNRLQAIDNIASSIPKDLVDKAKYSEVMNASDLALKVITDTAASGQNYFQNAIKDSKDSGVDNLKPDPVDVTDEDEDEALSNIMVKAANSKRKEIK